MAISNSSEILNIEQKHLPNDLLKGLLHIHQKLKHIAKIESERKLKAEHKLAKLDSNEIKLLKDWELKSGYVLVAYKPQDRNFTKKQNILGEVDKLLEEFLRLNQLSETSNKDDFSAFFE